MDNNAAELSICGLCIGKKKWVMIDTVACAKSNAIIYSIAETAKANNRKGRLHFCNIILNMEKLKFMLGK